MLQIERQKIRQIDKTEVKAEDRKIDNFSTTIYPLPNLVTYNGKILPVPAVTEILNIIKITVHYQYGVDYNSIVILWLQMF